MNHCNPCSQAEQGGSPEGCFRDLAGWKDIQIVNRNGCGARRHILEEERRKLVGHLLIQSQFRGSIVQTACSLNPHDFCQGMFVTGDRPMDHYGTAEKKVKRLFKTNPLHESMVKTAWAFALVVSSSEPAHGWKADNRPSHLKMPLAEHLELARRFSGSANKGGVHSCSV